MSLFPYNHNKSGEYGSQGSPFNFDKAMEMADEIYSWHYCNDTDHWTQSSDGADIAMQEIAIGLMTMLADPGFVNMIQTIGKGTMHSISTIEFLCQREGLQYLSKDSQDTVKMLIELGLLSKSDIRKKKEKVKEKKR